MDIGIQYMVVESEVSEMCRNPLIGGVLIKVTKISF